jgi:acetyl esterase/lipase
MELLKLWECVPGYIDGAECPVLEYYPAENKKSRGAIVIFPGGGYSHRAIHEGEGYALFLNSYGIDCFVCEYRVAPYRFPYPLLDARRAVRYVRANAEKYGIDPGKIAVMGSSAGGHLAETLCTYKGKIEGESTDAIDCIDPIPNAQILCYPVTDYDSHNGSYKNLLGDAFSDAECERLNPIANVTNDAPIAFLWHTETDRTVKIRGTFDYAVALHNADVRCEMHVYPTGHHGMGLAQQDQCVARWSDDLVYWLGYNGYLE